MAYGPYSYSTSVDDDDYIDVYNDGETRKTTMAVVKDYVETGAFVSTGAVSGTDVTASGYVDVGTYLQLPATTVAALPATPAVGMVAQVNDADTPSVGSTVTGGAAAAAAVWYNGSNWTVIGV